MERIINNTVGFHLHFTASLEKRIEIKQCFFPPLFFEEKQNNARRAAYLYLSNAINWPQVINYYKIMNLENVNIKLDRKHILNWMSTLMKLSLQTKYIYTNPKTVEKDVSTDSWILLLARIFLSIFSLNNTNITRMYLCIYI